MNPRTNNIRAFYVVQFMELPFEGVDDYVCVPYSWLVKRRVGVLGDDRAMVAYPIGEDPFDTRDRAKRKERPNDAWKLYQANVKYESDTYGDAEFWLATRNDYGPIIENESNISVISQYEVPPPLATPSAPRAQPSPEPVASATPGTSRQRRRQPAGPTLAPTRATSPLPPVPTTPPPSNSRQRLTAASPHSSVATPHRRYLRARRTLTPFDRATSEFVAIEQRRLQLEERMAQTEARRVEVDNERNNLLSRFANIAEAFLQQYLDRVRDSDFTA